MRTIRFFGKKQLFSQSVSLEKLSGVIVPLITPMNEDRSVDTFALKTLVARMMNKGVKNFFVLSNFAEPDFLSVEEKVKVLRTVSEEINGAGIMLVGCYGENADEVIDAVLFAQKFTNICVVGAPESALERELEFIDFFDSLFTRTAAKIIVHNNSFFTKKPIPALWLDNIINWERLIGVIDASRNPDYLDELGKYYQLTRIFEEKEESAFDALNRNFAGLSPLSANIFPAYYVKLIEEFSALDFHTVARNEAKILALCRLIPANKRIQAVKYVLFLQHLAGAYYSPKLEPLSEKEMRLIESAFSQRRVTARVL